MAELTIERMMDIEEKCALVVGSTTFHEYTEQKYSEARRETLREVAEKLERLEKDGGVGKDTVTLKDKFVWIIDKTDWVEFLQSLEGK